MPPRALTHFKDATLRARFWNPYTQTLPRAELDRLHLRKLQALVRYAYARSPMYRRLLDRARVKPADIRMLDDFVERLPVIDKKDVLDAQGVAPPFGEALAVPEDFFLHRFQTSGSTGVPLHIPLTYHSSLLWGESWVYLYWAMGLRPRHSFYFPFHWGRPRVRFRHGRPAPRSDPLARAGGREAFAEGQGSDQSRRRARLAEGHLLAVGRGRRRGSPVMRGSWRETRRRPKRCSPDAVQSSPSSGGNRLNPPARCGASAGSWSTTNRPPGGRGHGVMRRGLCVSRQSLARDGRGVPACPRRPSHALPHPALRPRARRAKS
jgi:hypothetical protein